MLASVPLLVAVVYFAAPLPSADWYATFYPAAREVLFLHSPYEQSMYLNPPWTVLLLFPFVIFPPVLSHGLFFVVCALLLAYVAWRLQASPLALGALLLSPTAVGALLVNNLDPLLLVGMLLPPVWGLIFLLIKPQIGIGVAIYYFYDIWQKQRWRGLVLTFAPVTILYLVSALLFPVWIERMLHNSQIVWNRSFFPYSIPLGLFFMWLSFRYKNPYFALAASPFFAPYISFYSYVVVQIALLHRDVEKVIRRDLLQLILAVFLWTIMLVFHL